MRRVHWALALAGMVVLLGARVASPQPSPSITIADIVANAAISGAVAGLPADTVPLHKVVVYVRTDQWYIHPYAGQGENLSWAAIRPDGTWRLNTVQREFKATEIAALLVTRDLAEPARMHDIDRVPSKARTIVTLSGHRWYGRL